MPGLSQLPNAVLQLLAIFLSIIIEALPFVLLGAILSGFIEVFVTPKHIQRLLPKQTLPRIIFGTCIGFIFPSCECGIVPIVCRFLEKKVPSYTAIPFMATAPVINPIVLFATYSAFGNTWRMVFLRLVGASLVALILGCFLAFVWTDPILKTDDTLSHSHWHHHDDKELQALTLPQKIFTSLTHAIDEVFSVGPYLVFGALFAAAIQIFVPTRLLTTITATPLVAILLMMLLAAIMSLCSEADAFIGVSLLSSFGSAPVMAFLLLGPLVDIKNLLMMTNVFKTRFIIQFVSVSCLVIILYCLILGRFI